MHLVVVVAVMVTGGAGWAGGWQTEKVMGKPVGQTYGGEEGVERASLGSIQASFSSTSSAWRCTGVAACACFTPTRLRVDAAGGDADLGPLVCCLTRYPH